MMQKSVLLALLAASADATSPNTNANLRSRELWGSSSSGSGWSFWGSLLQLLDHMHTPCPPGHLHHKDENGDPLHRGECWQDLHKPKAHHHKKSGGGGGGGGGGGSSSYQNGYSSYSYSSGGSTVTYTFVECTEGDNGCYANALCNPEAEDYADCLQWIMCQDNDQDCQMWIKCDDDQTDCMANVDLEGLWAGDGHVSTTSTTAAPAPIEYDDDTWGTDGWVGNNLNNQAAYASKEANNAGGMPIWPFLVGALVAGVVGAMFVVSRRKRREEQDDHPLDGAIKKRQRLFNGFSRKKKGALNEDFDNEDDSPKFVEISEAKKKYSSPSVK